MWYFTSDLHLGHEFCIKDRGFSNSKQMKEKIYSMFDVVKKGDVVYVLGDIAWSKEDATDFIDYIIKQKKVERLFILEGNHDTKHWLNGFTYEHPRLTICQSMLLKQTGDYSAIFMSHYPQIIYDKSHYNSFQLHGHGHTNTSDRPLLDNLILGKRLNVNCELNDYKLWSRDDVEKYMQNMPNNIDYYLCKGDDNQKKIVIKLLCKINESIKRAYKKLK